LGLPCSLTLTPQTQPHSEKTATAVHSLFANAPAQDNVSGLVEKDFIFAYNSKYIYYFCVYNFLTDN